MEEVNKSNGADVKAEIERVLEEVEDTLSSVLTEIRRLDEESQHAKTEITQAVGRQLTHLHNRQTQLLRQVDVICQARGELLHDQLAHCYRLLGSLQTQKWVDKLQHPRSAITVPGLSGLKKANSLNWSLNEAALNSAIEGFGHVDMEGILLMGSSEQSKCLPARFEDYFEDDQHVMEKSLNSSNVINICFPKLPKDYSYWLSCNKRDEEKSLELTNYGPYRKSLGSFKPCDVQTWLGCIQTETAAEPMEDHDSIPEMVSISSDVSTSSKQSSDIGSIEVVTTSCFRPLDSCKQQGITDMEIENLGEKFSLCMSDKQQWLAPNRKRFDDIPIAKTCRANETCKSYDGCVCEDNCHDVAMKNRDQKQQQQQHQLSKKNEMSRWLRTSSSSKALSSPSAPSNVPIFPASLKQSVTGDASQWLAKRPSHKMKDSTNQQLKNLQPPTLRTSDVTGPWLRGSGSNNLNNPSTEKPVKIHTKLQNFPQDQQLSQWLRVQ